MNNSVLYELAWMITRRKKRWKLLEKKGVKVGKDCEIYRQVEFGSEPYLITLGDKVRITNGVKFCTHDGGLWVLRNLGLDNKADIIGKIQIGNNVHIGWNSIIMPGVTIGNNCIIGCGAVVTKNIPDNSVAVGVPAKVIRTIEEYEENNKDKFIYTAKLSPEEKKEFLLRTFE